MDPHDIELIRALESDQWGAGRRSLARGATRGTDVRVRHGVYADAAAVASLGPREMHILQLRALAATASTPPVFSHRSAAVLLGLPLLERPKGLEITGSLGAVGHRVGVRGHVAELAPSEVTVVRGLRVTGPERTACDLARTSTFDEAVVVLDAVLRAGGEGARAVLDAAVLDTSRPRGHVALTKAVGFADGASESPGESVSRVTMAKIGLPTPILQHVFVDAFGRFIARGDFWFEEERVLGEMDGREKYMNAAMNGGDPARFVYREKVREDQIRALGIRVVRWDWQTARDTVRLAALFAAAGVHPVTR